MPPTRIAPPPPIPGTHGGTTPSMAPPAPNLIPPPPPSGNAPSDRPAPPIGERGGWGQRLVRPSGPGAPMLPDVRTPMDGAMLTVSKDTVYLLRGNTVYKFRASDLKVLGQALLPASIAPIAIQGVMPPDGSLPLRLPAPDGATPAPPGGPNTPGAPPAPATPDVL